MNNTYNQVWKSLENGIGKCFLYRNGAVKEICGLPSFTLTFATFAPLERIEEFLKDKKVINRSENQFVFTMNNARIELNFFKTDGEISAMQNKLLNHAIRCECLIINSNSQVIKNPTAYQDITERVIHFSSENPDFNDGVLGRILNYVLIHNFTIGEDVIDFCLKNEVMKKSALRSKFYQILVGSLNKKVTKWTNIAESLKLLKGVINSDTKLFVNTANLKGDISDKAYVRSFLYVVFKLMNATSKELQDFMKNEPSFRYFDSLCLNIYAVLHSYSEYSAIKSKYGDEFLELLMDVQELLTEIEGGTYKRVSDATFDMGEIFAADENLWCSIDEISSIEADNSADKKESFKIDPSKGDMNKWVGEEYNAEMYDDESKNTDKKYLDDEPDAKTTDTGIDKSALEAYENKPGNMPATEATDTPKTVAPQRKEQTVMNSVRGHESKVLNGGGI